MQTNSWQKKNNNHVKKATAWTKQRRSPRAIITTGYFSANILSETGFFPRKASIEPVKSRVELPINMRNESQHIRINIFLRRLL